MGEPLWSPMDDKGRPAAKTYPCGGICLLSGVGQAGGYCDPAANCPRRDVNQRDES